MTRLISLSDALNPVLQRSSPVATSRLPIEQAIGLPLAEPLVTCRISPEQPIALIGGFAASADALMGANAFEPAILTALSRVQAGDILPAGTDCVLPPDAVTWAGGLAECRMSLAPWENARPAGGDLMPGQILAEVGTLLCAELVLLLSEAGHDDVVVREVSLRLAPCFPKRWRMVASHWAHKNGWRIRDVNPEIELHCAEAGGLNLALSPGLGATLGGNLPIRIGIPPEPDAFVGIWHAIVLPLGHKLAATRPFIRHLPLLSKVSSKTGFAEMALLRREGEGLRPLECGTMSLSSLAHADYVALVGAESEGYCAGERAPAMPVGGATDKNNRDGNPGEQINHE